MSIIIMILLISVLILVHEAGHFLAAKFFKIKVDKFGFGLPFGPTIYEKKFGDLTVLVHAFLLGGYVSFPDDEKDCDLPKDSSDRFLNRPIYQRATVFSAGVFANFVTAFVFVFLTAAIWGNMPSGKFDIYVNDIVAPKTENIWASGLEKKDKIVKINGVKVDTVQALISFIQLSKTDDGKVDRIRVSNLNNELKKLNPILDTNETIPKDVAIKLPASSTESPVNIDKKVLKGMKKYEDKQISLNSKQIKLRNELKGKRAYISDGANSLNDIAIALADNSRPILLTVERNGQMINLNPVFANEKGMLGIKLEGQELLIPTKTPTSVIKVGTKYLFESTYMMIYGLYQLFTGKVPWQDLHGIILITKIGGDMIDTSGISTGLLLIAKVSMCLAIMNFLPFPALDGGHMMFLAIEKLRGKPLDEEIVNRIGNAGFMVLIVLMIYVLFNDIFALITNKF